MAEPRKHFLRLSHFRKQGCDEDSAIEGLVAKNFAQWEDTLSGNIISEAFAQSCERFIEIRSQSLLLFGFKSRAKEKPDLISAIKTINAIAN